MSIKFNYYFGKESESFSFFRIPKLLFTDPLFAKLSSDAKVLYGIMLDRMSLSMKNGWIDEENKVYIIFTIEEIAGIMNCATQKANKILKELDNNNGIGLIEKKRLGLGKPNILYVKNFIIEDSNIEELKGDRGKNTRFSKSQKLKCENHNSGNVKFTKQELLKSQCNNTDINKTEYSNTDYNNTSPLSPHDKRNMTDNSNKHLAEEKIKERFKKSIEYPTLLIEHKTDSEIIDLMINLMSEAVKSRADIKINNTWIPYEKIKDRFLSLRKEHIEYVLTYVSENRQRIGNLRAYLTSLLYNAPTNILGTSVNIAEKGTNLIDYSKDVLLWQEFLDST